MASRLTSTHLLCQRFDAVCAAFAEQGIRIDVLGHRTVLHDTRTGATYDLIDLDNRSPVADFPPAFEHMIVRGIP